MACDRACPGALQTGGRAPARLPPHEDHPRTLVPTFPSTWVVSLERVTRHAGLRNARHNTHGHVAQARFPR